VSLLRVSGLVAGYAADLPIVRGVSLALEDGEILVLLGPNGAGKSTLLKALAGVAATFAGDVVLGEKSIRGAPAHALCALGMGFVPQTGNIFSTLSVEENLRIGAHLLAGGMRERLERAYAQFPDLARQRRRPGSALSGGQRQMLAIARALMSEPRLLLLDEPSAGLSPMASRDLFADVRRIAQRGVAVLMVEQNARAALRIADRGLVMVNGQIAHGGPAGELAADPALGRAYLGTTP
jgi:ABC-type branched-subunit amino acid transport system ATPase component